MGLSFEDSLNAMKKAQETELNNLIAASRVAANTSSIATSSVEDYSISTLDESGSMIAAYSGDDGNWEHVSGYKVYSVYSDDNISMIDGDKNIVLNEKQYNITQEENSQYIPFEMPRYYDGYDLSTAGLSIHYNNKDKYHGVSIPVNVMRNSTTIRFGWLIGQEETAVAGLLKFEIQANGYTNYIDTDGIEKQAGYTWKSKFNEELNVEPSLCGNSCHDAIILDNSWATDLVESVAIKMAEKIAETGYDVSGQVEEAKTAANEAKQAATNVQNALSDYATIEYVDGEIGPIKASIDSINSDINNIENNYATKEEVGTLTDSEGNTITVQEYVDSAIANVDISDKIGNIEEGTTVKQYVDNRDTAVLASVNEKIGDLGESATVASYVDSAVAGVDVTDQLSDYAKSADVYTKAEVDAAIGNVSVDMSDYYNKTQVDDKIDVLSAGISDNADDIQSANSAITSINQTLAGIDKSPRVTYKATYGDVELDDGSTANYMFTLWKTENGVEEVQDRFQIAGGGSGSSSNLKTFGIKYVEDYGTPIATTVNEKAIVKYEFVGEDSVGDTNLDGTASWKVGNRVVATQEVSTGIREFDLTEYVVVGDNKVVLTITHSTGAIATKAWTIKVVDVRLESNFDDTRAYVANQPVNFTFTPYGGVDKTIHFLLDGKEIGTKISSSAAAGLSDSFSILAQEHGTHLFEIYMTAVINGKTVESNRIVKDIIWYYEASDVPVISTVYQTFTARQYEATNITYTVYDPSTETPSVSLKATYVNADDEIVEEYSSNLVLDSNTQIWQYKTDVIGEHTLTITCGDTVKTLVATIVELGINVSPITSGLAFDFNPVGYSNNDNNRLWNNGAVAMTVSDNFDWVNGGYQIDENGDQCFCIKSGTSADISYELFGDDAKTNGKQFKLIFKTKNVADGETTFLSCLSDNIGVEMKAHEATIYAETGSLPLPYAEEEVIEFEFNITPSSESPSMIMGYEDGVSTRPLVYDSTHNLQQYQGNRKTISLGSPDCDLYIYRFKVYNTSLSDRDILNNFIADARSAEEMIARYDRNQIYKEGILDPDYLAEVCPQLRIIKLEVPWFTNDKDDKVYNKDRQSIVECIYKGGDPVYDNWVAYDIVHSGQGTSSNNYGPAGRNLDLILKSYKDYGNAPYIILGDGSRVNKVSLTRESIPVNYFNVKVNIASSENANNALLAKRYNQYNPYNRPFVREDESIIPYIKDTMEFQNCVIFVKESDSDLSTHREFNDNNWHFYSFGNIGDSKKTDSSRLTDQDDPYECILEVMDNTLPNSTMPTGKVDDNGAPIYPILPSEWTAGNSAYDSLHADTFDEAKSTDKENGLADTYGWRYIYEYDEDKDPDAESKNAEVKSYVEDKWKEFYEFVVTSTDEEFKAHLGDYCVLDSVMYYYLFTLRYTMTDNHAKNSFWHYGKSNDKDSDGNPIRKWDLCFDYDNDTALGIDNYGRMTYRYGYEEIDYVDGTNDWVWNAPQHVFFLRLRELFDAELSELYTELESAGAWSATGLINQFNDWQMQFPEELWRLDIQRKYIRTYTESFINGKAYPEFLVERANGRKKTQRAQFEKNQEKYMSSKFSGTVASADDVILRCSVPNADLAVEPNFDMHLTPYSHVYLNVKYNTAPPVKVRAVPNQEYTIEYTDELADIIEIYSASCLKSIGDLSDCYLTNGTFANATKLRELKLGNDTEGYNNTNVMTLGLGSNELLNKLDIQNMSGLTHSLELSGLKNLEELYAFGSGVSGVVFADGGNIETVELPSVGSLQMKNLVYLDDEGFEVSSYDKLTKLIAENSELDLIDIINNSSNLRQVRLVGVDWTLDDTALLERLYGLAGVTNTGGNTDQSVLSGKVHVPVIKQQHLYEYQHAWPDLEITFDTMRLQHAVTFINEDGAVLDVQYVVEGEDAVDPITRIDNPISTPTKESTVSTNFTFAGWDSVLTGVFSERTIKATYTESTRSYTIKYVSKGTVMQESTGLYGSNIPYAGAVPTYVLEESAYKYYLFDRWDKSGFVDGDKIVNAIFDEFKYTDGCFAEKELIDMRPVEIYALTKLNSNGVVDASAILEDGDDYSFTMGYDIDYDDIDSELIISEKTSFTGSNKIDTGIKLFDEDRDFVLAIDYEMSSDTRSSGVLAQCFQSNGSNGFKLWNNSGVKFTWGSSSITPTSLNNREMIVIRHKKGDNNLYVYNSRLDESTFEASEIARTKNTIINSTLVFGCSKADDGAFENYAVGDIHWCKIWYKDLGEEVCEKLAGWTHEKIDMEICGFKKYYLTNPSSKRCSFTLLAKHLLERKRKYNNVNTSVGGWASSSLNEFLNNRFYNAMPMQIKSLIKQVTIWSSSGNMFTEMSSSECYVAIPAVVEVCRSSDIPNSTDEMKAAYSMEGTTISYMTSDGMRKRAHVDGNYSEYWLRSPNLGYASYIYQIGVEGGIEGYNLANETNVGVLIMISF